MYIKILSLTALFFLVSCSSEQKASSANSTLKTVKPSTQTAVQIKQVQSKVKLVQSTSRHGANLFAQKCASCHGENANKSALNASKIIAGWSSSKLQTSLTNYKTDLTYGGSMKGIMHGQSKPLSSTDIILISDYISIL